ncbi:MAG: YdeI/OmpD-associated family protein [Paludibacter sp.]|nr:YdeI/OmpD-associated family protein [Paludibacter sp.]
MIWSESVDEALCFGWMDGIRRSLDIENYCIRFTPRKPTSIWSAVNIEKVENLIEKGLMQPAGLEAFQRRRNEKSGIYSFENDNRELDEFLKQKFMENILTWEFFAVQPPSYRKMITHRIISAKQEKTKLVRLQKVISVSGEKKRLF